MSWAELTLPPLCLEVLKTMPMRRAQTKCKVRGITLNYRTAQKINFNLMCDMICLEALSDLTDRISVNIPFKIIRDTKEKSVKTRSENKD